MVFFTSCATVKSFKSGQVEQQTNQAFESAEEVNQRMKADFEVKKKLIADLRKQKSPKLKKVDDQVKQKLNFMESNLSAADGHRKKMTETKAQIAALTYGKKQVKGDEPAYSQLEEQVQSFEDAAKDFNAAVADYTRESNGLAELVAAQKLYFNFDVDEFQARVKMAIRSSNGNSKTMGQEIDRTQKIVNSFSEGEARTAAEQILNNMTNLSEENSNKIKQMNDLSEQLKDLAKGQSRIPSTSPDWGKLQEIVNDFERTSLAAGELNREFQIQVDRMRQASRSNP
ncbi:MAG: hypothetical protein AB7F86_02400 [Bdellovibrionales bacterium]